MKTSIRTYLCSDDNHRFFGEGPYRLLRAIDETGSLRSAALSMNMAYTKALRILKDAEAALGFLLTVRTTGGKGGGGGKLTEDVLNFMTKYEHYKDACTDSAMRHFEEIFKENKIDTEHNEEIRYLNNHKCKKSKIACIIMASGLSRRFGSNKLMAPFNGAPLIRSVINCINQVSDFGEILVVTRSKDVKNYCDLSGFPVLIHDCEHRNEAIRQGLSYLINNEVDLSGCLFALADQPLLHSQTVKRICVRFNDIKSESLRETPIIQACSVQMTDSKNQPVSAIIGSPILFDRAFFDELLNLPEKSGGSYVLRNHPEDVRYVTVDKPEELMDIDTPEELERAKKELL